MEKFIVPTFIEYNACQLTTGNLEGFKKFINDYGNNIKITFEDFKDKQIPIEISFKWNPDGCDYPPTVCVQLNQYFIYDTYDLTNYQILDPEEIGTEWYIYED